MAAPPRPLSRAAVLALTLALWSGEVPAGADLVAPAPPVVSDAPEAWPDPTGISATAYLLLDAGTGQVLAARRAGQQRAVASTVKILTALTVLERADLDETVEVGTEVEGLQGASVGLEPGERWTVAQLLSGLLVRSGNDAAVALATHVAGDVDTFVELMRRDAAALGIPGITVATPSGLDDINRLSARDLGVLARVAMADPRFRDIVARGEVTLPDIGSEPNRNELLGAYRGATGVKTGFTDEAGNCVVASARRGGRELIAVVLDAPTPQRRFEDARALLDLGFSRFGEVAVAGEVTLSVAGGSVTVSPATLSLLLPDAVQAAWRFDVPGALPGTVSAHLTSEGADLATREIDGPAPTRTQVEGGAALGRAAVDGVYAALRALLLGSSPAGDVVE